MSRKNKNFRAFIHQTPNPTAQEAWDAAWANQQSAFHARSMQAMESRVEELEAMVKVFRGCIETGVMPNQGSRCHKIIYDLVGESEE